MRWSSRVHHSNYLISARISGRVYGQPAKTPDFHPVSRAPRRPSETTKTNENLGFATKDVENFFDRSKNFFVLGSFHPPRPWNATFLTTKFAGPKGPAKIDWTFWGNFSRRHLCVSASGECLLRVFLLFTTSQASEGKQPPDRVGVVGPC